MTASTPPSKKSHLPVSSWAIERAGLHARLIASLEFKLTLVSAPPGYGKTTAVAEFAHGVSVPVAWHVLEPRERDVLNLQLHFLDAIEQAVPGITHAGFPTNQNAEELARAATDLIRQHIKTDFLYVLDDAQILNGYDAAEAWLRVFVDTLPTKTHLIIISRSTPKLPFLQMISRNEVLPISTEHLRFNKTELDELAQRLDVGKDATQHMENVLDTLEGWPAGTVLALQPLPESLEDVLPATGTRPEVLFNSLADSMLRAQAPLLRDFLLASSTFNRITPELCSRVLGYNNSSALLEQVNKKNLFLSRTSGGMIYHKLFRLFLQRRLHQDDPALFASYHLRAGVDFEQNRNLEEAFYHFIAGDAPQRASAIAERMAEVFFKQGRYETLLDWHRRLESHALPMPWLRYAIAMIYIDRLDYTSAIEELAQAEQDFLADANESALAKVRFQRAQIDLREGRIDACVRIAEALAELSDSAENLQGRALHLLGLASLRTGDAQAAADYMELATPLFRDFGDSYALSVVLQDLEAAYVRLGRTDDATRTLQEVVALRRVLQNPVALALALNNMGYHFHRHGFYSQAMSTLQEGLNILAGQSNRRTEGYLLWTLGDLLRDCRQFPAAEARYTRALEIVGDSEPALRCSLLISFAITHRWQQNARAACQLAEEALHIAEDIDAVPEKLLAECIAHAAEVDMGEDPDQALHDVQDAAADLQEGSALVELVYVLVLVADLALLANEQSTAQNALRYAIRTAEDGGGRQPLLAEVLNNPRLNALLEREGSRAQYLLDARDLLADADLTTPTDTDDEVSQPPTFSLRVFTLGTERVERDGETVTDWTTARAREVFMHLIFQGPLSRERLGVNFWPDKSPQKVRSNFHTNVDRARRALGRDTIRYEDKIYMVDPDLDIWCDAVEMEKLAQQARLMSSRTAYAEQQWQAAVDLYHGDFLPSMDANWIDTRRRELQELYFEALVELGGCLRIRGDIISAIATCERVLLIDPYREEAHREIMRCYGQSSEVGGVLKQYQYLEDLLEEELGVAPSQETIDLMVALTSPPTSV